eukprot:2469431-Prymnesium_polylepis.1
MVDQRHPRRSRTSQKKEERRGGTRAPRHPDGTSTRTGRRHHSEAPQAKAPHVPETFVCIR